MARFLDPLRRRDFLLFWSAMAISLVGDQLTFIALPWLVLMVTGDPLVMGTVMAVAGIPRALLMLVGGVVTDAVSPRTVLLLSTTLRGLLIGTLAGLTAAGAVEVWMLFAIGFLFGVADAFAFPAGSTIPRRLLCDEELAAGNGLIQGSAQISLAIGPVLAGALIALLGSGETGSAEGGITDGTGLAVAFGLDALTFLLGCLLLLAMRPMAASGGGAEGSLLESIALGLRYVWDDMALRVITILFAIMGLVFRGPFVVGVPAFAEGHLEEGALAFGVMMSMIGLGSLLGAILAGTTKLPDGRWLAPGLLLVFAAYGLILILMTLVPDLYLLSGLILIAAIVDGFMVIWAITWLQTRVEVALLGRVMSVVMLAGQGLFPISAAAAGVLAGIDVLLMLRVGGGLLVLIVVLFLLVPAVRRTGHPVG